MKSLSYLLRAISFTLICTLILFGAFAQDSTSTGSSTVAAWLPSVGVLLSALFGMLLFFAFEYVSKKKLADFSLPTWIKDNWWKIVLLGPACLLAWIKFFDADITEKSAFFVGMTVTTIIDRIQDIATKNKSS